MPSSAPEAARSGVRVLECTDPTYLLRAGSAGLWNPDFAALNPGYAYLDFFIAKPPFTGSA